MVSYAIKPRRTQNDDYVNISNNNEENNNLLLIDLKTINFENISVELALNVLRLKHKIYYDMTQNDIIQFYNNKMKLTNNIDTILALKIILKAKLKGLDIKINKSNGITFGNSNKNLKNSSKNIISETEQKINSILDKNDLNFKIKQVQQNNFKIIQQNTTQNLYKNIVEYPNKTPNFYIQQNNLSNNLNIANQNTNSNTANKNYLSNNVNIANQNANANIANQNANANIANQNNFLNTVNITNGPNNNLEKNDSKSQVINSSEFDIDSIINSYAQKKYYGLVK